jgi:hypothetical protein
MKIWAFNPHSGGRTISPRLRIDVAERLKKHAASKYKGLYSRIDIRFRGALCYIDAYKEPRQPDQKLLEITHESKAAYFERIRSFPIHLGRIRHFGDEKWSYAFYTYSNERYEAATFGNGEWFGTPEQAFDISARYLFDE